jgi:hypothetical protein
MTSEPPVNRALFPPSTASADTRTVCEAAVRGLHNTTGRAA